MRTTLLSAVCVISPLFLGAQDCSTGRYTDPGAFPDVTVTQAVEFGSNTAVSGGTQILRMDVYEPTGDLLTERPVVLVAFGGSFIAGTRADVADICMTFAHMGYVAVAPDYRVGFFLPNEATTTRAVMRGSHDMKACVRYLRKTVAEDGNPYGIDPDRIISGGVSAGAISAIHATYLDQEAEIPAVLVPEAPALGGVEGNSGTPGYSSAVFACYSFSGAIGDTSWIVPNDRPLASVHEVGDNVVPYYTQEVAVIGIPTGLIASGSHDIHVRLDNIEVPNCFLSYPTNGHVGYLTSDPVNSVGFVAQFMADL
ncbi:MAG: alpha/beta hydrolase, partial [Flavobacteriales bacterium]|nr:alpha/beta hydrolase [Flavobacteriales bacterium]